MMDVPAQIDDERRIADAAVSIRSSAARVLLATVARDIKLEFRSRDALNAMLFYAVLVIIIFSFAFEAGSEATNGVRGGLLWVAFLFAGLLALDRAFLRELPNACLTGLRMSPASRSAVVTGKFTSSFLLMIGVEAILLPIFAVLFNAPASARWGWIALTIVLGTWALASTGTYFSAMSTHTRNRTLLLPLLLLPAIVPAVLATVQATQILLSARGDARYWLQILFAYDVIFTALGVGLADVVLDRE